MMNQQPIRVAGTNAGPMGSLGEALDAASYDWLVEQYPDIAEAIESALARGATPRQIKHYVLGQTGRLELALRCEQAARHAGRNDQT